jgi:hypothetical protein
VTRRPGQLGSPSALRRNAGLRLIACSTRTDQPVGLARLACLPGADGKVGVGEAVDGGEHGGEDVQVEARVVVGGPLEQAVVALALSQGVHVGEVSGLGGRRPGSYARQDRAA